MPDRHAAPRCGILIPVRLASERLPGKALLDVAGQPALYHLLDRARACRFVDLADVVVCTTTEPSDDPLVRSVERYGAGVFRGVRDDLIRRFHDAVAAFGLDLVVEADGDDLCAATEYMDACFEALLAEPAADVVTCADLPLGVAPRGFTRAAIERVVEHYESQVNDTGFFQLFTATGLCREVRLAPLSAAHRHDDVRLTLDYAEDLALFRDLLGALGAPGRPAALAELVAHLRAEPELAASNLHMNDAFWQRTAEKARLSYRDADGHVRELGGEA